MTAQTLMSPNPVTLQPTDTLEQGIDALLQHRFTALPVVDANGRYVGSLSMRHVLGLVVPQTARRLDGDLLPSLSYVHESLGDVRERLEGLRERPLGDFLDTSTPIVKADTGITEVLWLLFRDHHYLLPVVDENDKLLGIVTAWRALMPVVEKK